MPDAAGEIRIPGPYSTGRLPGRPGKEPPPHSYAAEIDQHTQVAVQAVTSAREAVAGLIRHPGEPGFYIDPHALKLALEAAADKLAVVRSMIEAARGRT